MKRIFFTVFLVISLLAGCRPVPEKEPVLPEKPAEEKMPEKEPAASVPPPQIVLPQPLVEVIPLPPEPAASSELKKSQQDLENRVNFLGLQIEDLKGQIERVGNSLSSTEHHLKADSTALTAHLEQKLQS
ncbi:MAG TPA: hypothetical protein PKW42_05310 [bacterium]|nr:hypothetical protein [bacterium]